MANAHHFNGGGGEPRRASQRHHRPPIASAPPAFAPGDRVRFTDRHVGVILRVIGDQAEIEEHEVLGRRSIWRLRLDALTPA
jgi:hypothetical protein